MLLRWLLTSESLRGDKTQYMRGQVDVYVYFHRLLSYEYGEPFTFPALPQLDSYGDDMQNSISNPVSAFSLDVQFFRALRLQLNEFRFHLYLFLA